MALIELKSNLSNINKNKTDLTSQKEANADANHSKLRPDDDQLVVRKIGKKYRGTKLDGGLSRGGAALQVERSAEDVKRIGKFLFSGRGALFTVKQAVLQNQNEDRQTNVYDPTSIIKNLSPKGDFQRHIDKGNVIGSLLGGSSKNQYEKFVEEGSHKSVSLRRDYKEVVSAVNLTNPKKRGTINVKYGGDFGTINKLNKAGDTLPKDFIKFRIRDAVNGKWIIFPALLSGGITDNSSAESSPTQYIGRPDKVYVYGGYTRSISFTINVVATTEKDIPIIWEKVNYAKGLVLPQYKDFTDIGVNERPVAPIVNLTLGDLYNDTPGFFTSVNMSIPENATWELQEGKQVPHLCTLAFEFTYIGKENPTMQSKQFDNISKLFKFKESDDEKPLSFTKRFLSREQRKSVRESFQKDIDSGISRRDARKLRRARRRGLRQENRNA